jgi:hypothetical protein
VSSLLQLASSHEADKDCFGAQEAVRARSAAQRNDCERQDNQFMVLLLDEVNRISTMMEATEECAGAQEARSARSAAITELSTQAGIGWMMLSTR